MSLAVHWRRVLALAGLFLAVALPFVTRPALIGGDEPHYALAAHSLATDGDVALENDYAAVAAGSKAAGRKFAGRELDPHLVRYDGNLYFAHPLGLPLLATPPLALLQAVRPGAAPDVLLVALGMVLSFLALVAGWRLLSERCDSAADGYLLAFALFFATPLWFYSRLFFTEGHTWSLAVLAVYALTRQRWVGASVLLGILFLLKEANILLILPILGGVAMRLGRRRALLIGLGPLASFGAWAVKNQLVYGDPLKTYQPFQFGDPIQGALGLLIDRQHGLLPFAPILLLALIAAGRRRQRDSADLEILSLGAFLAAFAMTACWNIWQGGSCYGPRLLTPFIPALALSLVAAWESARDSREGRRFFAVLVAVGFAIQLLAALDPFLAFWEIDIVALLTDRAWVSMLALLAGLGIALPLTRERPTAPTPEG